ncbi:MAG: hypothetical protein ABW221_06815 [Vicinamibacteria bacterium]
MGLPTADPQTLQVVLIAAASALYAHFLASEILRGRFARIDPRAPEDDGWLAANLPRPAEAAGAWDDVLGATEVAATLARLSQDGRLRSRASGDGHDLVVTLVAAREAFSGHERALVDRIFPGDWNETSTTMLVHKNKGTFKLAPVVRPGLKQRVAEVLGAPVPAWPRWIAPVAAFAAAAFFVWSNGAPPAQVPIRLVLAGLVFAAPGLLIARLARRRIDWGIRALAAATAAPLVVLGLAWPIAGDPSRAQAFVDVPADAGLLAAIQAAVVCCALGWTAVLLNAARTRHRAAGIAARKRLAAVRLFFATELGRPHPRLRDEWFPYVVALGLREPSRRWIVVHGAGAVSAGWTGGGPAVGGRGSMFWIRAAHVLARGGERFVHFSRGLHGP